MDDGDERNQICQIDSLVILSQISENGLICVDQMWIFTDFNNFIFDMIYLLNKLLQIPN